MEIAKIGISRINSILLRQSLGAVSPVGAWNSIKKVVVDLSEKEYQRE